MPVVNTNIVYLVLIVFGAHITRVSFTWLFVRFSSLCLHVQQGKVLLLSPLGYLSYDLFFSLLHFYTIDISAVKLSLSINGGTFVLELVRISFTFCVFFFSITEIETRALRS